MPKVNIYQPAYQGYNIETGLPVEPVQDRRISVGWSKERHAQVGVGWIVPKVNYVITNNNATAPATATTGTLLTMPGETDEQGREWQSQWMDLDRHTINQLIRELRKARDEAFGRDE